jgi:chromodomain-helicase-DNA-binding protein 4
MAATWEIPPSEDSPRYAAFKSAYEEYVQGEWTTTPTLRGQKSPYADPGKAEDIIQAEFGHRLEMKEQPEWLEGGKMFDYQLEGMKYLPFEIHTNVELAIFSMV